jgi:tetratricopeptide (TPR) repeat protein
MLREVRTEDRGEGRREWHSVCRSTCAVMLALIVAVSAGMATVHAGKTPLPPSANVDSLRAQDHIAQLMQWGEYALGNERFSEAETRFNDVLGLDWNHPLAFRMLQETRLQRARTLADWERLAQAAQAKGDIQLAIRYFEKIATEDPAQDRIKAALARLQRRAHADRLIQAGLSKFILEDYAGAALDFEQALTVVPADSLAAVYRDRAESKMAGTSSMADLRADTAMWGKYSDALKRLRDGDLAGAEQLWNQVLVKYPGNDAVRSNLEQIARRRKQELTSEEFSP